MTEPLSFGDILEAALRASSICQPDPAAESSGDDDAQLYMRAAGWVLAICIAEVYPVDFADAWDALCHVPGEMLVLIESPAGWTTLADHVARDLGIASRPMLIPTVH